MKPIHYPIAECNRATRICSKNIGHACGKINLFELVVDIRNTHGRFDRAAPLPFRTSYHGDNASPQTNTSQPDWIESSSQ